MADIAQIGFAADTSNLQKAQSALVALVPAAKAAETAAMNTADAIADVGSASAAVSTATTKTVSAVKAVANGLSAHSSAAKIATQSNQVLAKSHAGLSTQAMAAQHAIRSMVEQLAMGMPISTIFSAQINHLSFAASGPGGLTKAFSDAIGVFTKLLTPMVLVGGAIAALAVGAIAAYASWKTFTLGLIDTASIAGTTTKSLMELQAAASIRGIGASDFTAGIRSFSKSVYDARNNMGGLADLFTANNIKANTFDDYLEKASELIKHAANDQARLVLLQQMGLPANMEWVRLMSSGAEGLRKAKEEMAGFTANDNLGAAARRFDEAWNKAWTNFSLNARSGFQKALEFGATFFDKMERLAQNIGSGSFWDRFLPEGHEKTAKSMGITPLSEIEKRSAGDSPNPAANNTSLADALRDKAARMTGKATIDPNALKNAISLQQQSIALLGDLATVDQQVTSKQLELTAAGLNHVSVTKQQHDAIVNATKAQAENNLVNAQAQAGIFNLSLAQKAAADTLQYWIDKGLVDKNNVDQMAAAHLVLARNIQQVSEAAQVAAAPLQQLKQLELESSNFSKMLDTTLTGTFNNLVTPIQDVMNHVTTLGQGFKNVGIIIVKAIQEMVIKMLILAPIMKGIQSLMGGFGGFGGLFGFSSGGIPGASGPTSLGGAPLVSNALGGVYGPNNLSSFSGQVVNRPTLFKFASGAGLMGEAGSEGILPLKRGPNGSLGVQMYGQHQNDNQPTQITYAPQYNVAQGADPRAIAELKKAQAEDRARFSANVVQSIQNARSRNVRV